MMKKKQQQQQAMYRAAEERNFLLPLSRQTDSPTQLQLFSGFQALNGTMLQGGGGDHNANNNNPVESRKRSREAELFVPPQTQQYTFMPILDPPNNNNNQGITGRRTVLTGLQLALDDERANSSCTTTVVSGQCDASSHSTFLGESLSREIQRQREDIDKFVKLQGEQMRKAIEETRQRHMESLLLKMEEVVGRKLHKWQVEIENISRQNVELEEQVNQYMQDSQSWQNKAQCNEAMVTVLRANLQHVQAVVAQSRDQSREGCGESEVEDAASSLQGANNAEDFAMGAFRERKMHPKERCCRLCGSADICILLVPCKHLCLCKDCEGKVDKCPLCMSVKTRSVEVYLS